MRRYSRLALILLLAVIVPFGAVFLSIPLYMRAQTAKLSATWYPSWRVLFWSRIWATFYRVPYPLVLAILSNEGASVLHETTSNEESALDGLTIPPQIYPLGDMSISRGPAVGSGQVLRTNVERKWQETPFYVRWLVSTSDARKLAFPGQEWRSTWALVVMLRETLEASEGDTTEAARRYNGSGEAAQKYAAKAAAKMEVLS